MSGPESFPLHIKTPQEEGRERVEAYTVELALQEKALREGALYTADCEDRVGQLRAALEQFQEQMREKKLDALAQEAVQEQVHAIENEIGRLDMLIEEQHITMSELKEMREKLIIDKNYMEKNDLPQKRS